MKQICRDLTWEQENLDALVRHLDETEWKQVTLFDNWTIKDEICHLAYFDHTARLAVTDATAFKHHIVKDFGKIKDMDEVTQISLSKGRAMETRDLLSWWREERLLVVTQLEKLSPKDRLPWYGPPMSALSFATARLMETWAHGQDIFDILNKIRPASSGLKHIAHLGVTTFGWSFSNRGMEIPKMDIHIELTAPSGETWAWGEKTGQESITGPAEDFCLVVTQRRHINDTRLKTVGDVSRTWMELAQAFAGPPEQGPCAGQFAKR